MHLDTTQQEIAGALKDNTVLLAEASLSSMRWGGRGPHPVPPAHSLPHRLHLKVQKTMKENLGIAEDNLADIEARIKRLQK